MSQTEALRQIVRGLMRVMLISERTPPAHRHVTRYNPQDFHTLGLLLERPGMKSGALAQALGVVPTTASSLIARLGRQGLVRKERDAADGRAVALHLTSEGEVLARQIRDQDLANMELFLSALAPDEREMLLALLGKVTAHVAHLED